MCPVGCKNKRTKAESAIPKLTTESAYDIKEMRGGENHAHKRQKDKPKKQVESCLHTWKVSIRVILSWRKKWALCPPQVEWPSGSRGIFLIQKKQEGNFKAESASFTKETLQDSSDWVRKWDTKCKTNLKRIHRKNESFKWKTQNCQFYATWLIFSFSLSLHAVMSNASCSLVWFCRRQWSPFRSQSLNLTQGIVLNKFARELHPCIEIPVD